METTIQNVMNKMYKQLNLDRVVGELVLDTPIENDDAADTANGNGSLRGAGRKLPWSDVEMCTYQDGPLKGENIPGCVFDIDCYTWVDCHYCTEYDDDDDWNIAYYKEPLCHLCIDDDDSGWFPKTWAPTQSPSKTPSQAPSQAPSGGPTEDVAIGLEEERGPDMPFYYLPPPTLNPTPSPTMDPNLEILWHLQHSPFSRFQGITWVGLGGGWRRN